MSFEINHRGIGRDISLTMQGTGIVVGTDEDKPGKISANNTLTLAADNDQFIGTIGHIEKDLMTTLDPEGVFELPYTGAAPTVGVVKIVCNGAGGVKVDAVNGLPVLVTKVDTVGAIVTFFKS